MQKKMLTVFVALFLFTSFLQAQSKKVKIVTDMGTIKVMLYDGTPQHRDNFVKLVQEKFYDGLLFHRVIKDFMIQGGDPKSKDAAPDQALGNGDVGYTVPAEFNDNYFHKKGALAAARDNNPQKASSGCQFYLVQGKVFDEESLQSAARRGARPLSDEQKEVYKTIGGTPHLDGNYTVFGEIYKGLKVVDKIAAQSTGANDRPKKDIHIKKMRLIR
ncbi:MAG: peptidylprolyl isomerase [Sphingobacteriales bacterium]|nr:peptidylprolyl isomerase [Sphingobacteriales bacterium]